MRADFSFAYPDASIASKAAALEAVLAPLKQDILTANNLGAKPCLRAAFARDADDIIDASQILRANKHVIVMGTGGSSLGAKMLCEALAEKSKKTPTLHFVENTDAHTLEQLWQALDVAQTGLLIISKSGHTVEALAPALWWLERLDAAQQKAVASRSLAIAVEGENPLRALAQHYGMKCLTHAADVEGRFSIFTHVGLLPAAVAGIDIAAIRDGAQSACEEAALTQTAKAAAWQVAQMQAGKHVHSAWIYSDRLFGLGQWFRQGWCESIGKDGQGSLLVEARGSVDQHSVLQLLLDGPKDKVVTLLTASAQDSEPVIQVPAALHHSLGFLHDISLSHVLHAQSQMTLQLMKKAGVPVRVLHLATVDAKHIGYAIMSFMLEIVMAAELMQINAFNQPAIEDSKRLIREHLAHQSSAA